MAEKWSPELIALRAIHGSEKLGAAIDLHLQVKKRDSPSLFFTPNIGQERFIKLYERENPPMVGGMLCGNGVGKTCQLANTIVAIVWPELSNPVYMRGMAQNLKQKLPVSPRGRIVCHGDDIKPGGSLYEEMVQWFPKGKYEFKKEGKNHVSTIVCFKKVGDKTLEINIDVKTFDQPSTAHAGANLDFILINEPPPQKIYDENISRLRNAQCPLMMLFMTPLGVAAWLYDQLVEGADDVNVCVVYASIWDNCKDIPGNRGVLAKKTIKLMIEEWTKSDPDEAKARETGQFRHLAGKIYKTFERHVHTCDEFDIPQDWPVYHICDPHDTRDPATIWVAQSPMNEFFIVREYPNNNYVTQKSTRLRADEHVEDFNKIERKTFRKGQVRYRIMDPNKGKTRSTQTGKTIQTFYKDAGMNFKCDGVNDDLEVGHKEVRNLLHYDNQIELDELNHPRLYIFNNCKNTIAALEKYAYKLDTSGTSLTDKIDGKYKDFADAVRYFAVSTRPFISARGGSSDADRLKRGREKAMGN